jgi:hypothetical protein
MPARCRYPSSAVWFLYVRHSFSFASFQYYLGKCDPDAEKLQLPGSTLWHHFERCPQTRRCAISADTPVLDRSTHTGKILSFRSPVRYSPPQRRSDAATRWVQSFTHAIAVALDTLTRLYHAEFRWHIDALQGIDSRCSGSAGMQALEVSPLPPYKRRARPERHVSRMQRAYAGMISADWHAQGSVPRPRTEQGATERGARAPAVSQLARVDSSRHVVQSTGLSYHRSAFVFLDRPETNAFSLYCFSECDQSDHAAWNRRPSASSPGLDQARCFS